MVSAVQFRLPMHHLPPGVISSEKLLSVPHHVLLWMASVSEWTFACVASAVPLTDEPNGINPIADGFSPAWIGLVSWSIRHLLVRIRLE
jgi:hypothetical protein